MKAYIDHLSIEIGGLAENYSQRVEVEILTFDGDNYCKILFEGKVLEVTTANLFIDSSRSSNRTVKELDLSRLPKDLPSEQVMESITRINIDDKNKNYNRINEILLESGYKTVTPKLKDKVYRLFCEVYIIKKDNDIDLHSAFASKLDISRSHAKELAMRIYFDSSNVRLLSGSEDVISIGKNKD